jgi:transposase
VSFSPSADLADAGIFTHAHLPAAAAYCRKLGLVEIVNGAVPSEMDVSPGVAVQAMVLDTFAGRSPLYRVEKFLASQDVELLLGEQFRAGQFNDTNLARALDAIYEAGTGKVLGALGVAAAKAFGLDSSRVRYDTTSVSVWGDYAACAGDSPPDGPRLVRGHSKDNRPELKQFMLELLCVDRAVPILGGTLDGNSSDKTSNHELLMRIGSIMARHGLGPGAFVYVADSALVTEDNLDLLPGTLFVTRLPFTYGVCAEAVDRAVEADRWMELGALAEEKAASSSRPPALYKVFETEVHVHGRDYRALVVHSSSHDKRRLKRLGKLFNESVKTLSAKIKGLAKTFFCRADAEAAAARAAKLSTRLHRVDATVAEIQAPGRGRPPKNRPRRTTAKYEITCAVKEAEEELAKERLRAGCFVLLTNIPASGPSGMDGGALLATYKGQNCVEANFSFLKDPLVVNDLFLKTPSRIEALGMILIIALMVWRLMERSMRVNLPTVGGKLPGWDNKKTSKPTAFMMSVLMAGVMTAVIDGKRMFLRKPEWTHRMYLEALGLNQSIYLDPTAKCVPGIPLKSTSDG